MMTILMVRMLGSTILQLPQPDSVEAIVQNVVVNEQLYGNIEVRWRRDYRMNPAVIDEPVEGLCLRRTHIIEVVRQGECFLERYEETDTDHLGKVRPVKVLLHAFDGRRTLEMAPPLVNIHQGRIDDCSYFIPHSSFSIREMLDSCVPLSTWLQREKVTQTRRGKQGLYDHHAVTLEGEKDLNGLRTLVLRCEMGPNAKEFRRLRFYLAPDKNYLPAQVESGEGDLPITRKSFVNSWIEIAPSVWLPQSATMQCYTKPGGDGKIGKVYAIDEKEILEAKLNPNYPVEFFRDVQLPANATVYEYVDGTVVKKYQLTPFTRLDGVPDAWRNFWRWLALALGLSALVGGLLWWRWRLRRPAVAGN